MALYENSRYIKTSLRQDDNETIVLGVRNRVSFPSMNAVYYTFIDGDTIDSLAYRMYNNAQLWWVIMDANPQFISELDIMPGDVLMIPSYDEVVKFYGG